MGVSGKGLITSLGPKAIRRSKTVKKAKFAITEVILKYVSNIFKEFKDVPYEGYVRKRSKQMPTDSYLYLTKHLTNFLMNTKKIINSRGLVRAQNMSMQNMSNSRVCSTDESKKKAFTSTRANKKGLTSPRVQRTRANKKAFIKWV